MKRILKMPIRRARADGARNRERLLEAAKAAFAQEDALPSMDEIARVSGLSSATLYRHFATRDALIEAVYRSEVEKLAAAYEEFAQWKTPMEALREWMLLFVNHVEAKLLILPAMDSVEGGSARLLEGARPVIHATFAKAVERAVESGELRAEVLPDDFLRAMVGIFQTTAMPGWAESARRLVGMLVEGARAR